MDIGTVVLVISIIIAAFGALLEHNGRKADRLRGRRPRTPH